MRHILFNFANTSLLLLLLITSEAMSQNAQIQAARERLNNGDTAGALGLLESVANEYPESADVYYWLGLVYYKSERITDALTSAKKAYAIKPNHLLNRSLLLDIYLKEENFRDAKAEAEFLLKESPKDLDLRFRFAQCLTGLSQFEEASIELSKLEVHKNVPYNLQYKVLLLLGDVYAKQNINATAIIYYSKAASLNSSSVDVHIKLGKTYFKDRRYNDALKEYLEVVRLDSNNAEGNLNVGYIYYNGGKSNPQQFGNAIYYLLKFTAVEPSDHRGFAYIGRSYHALRSYSNAIPPLRTAAQLDSGAGREETMKFLAESYSGIQDHENTIKTYEELEKKQYPLDAMDYVRLGLSYKAVKDTLNTGKYFSKAASADSLYHVLLQEVGLMYYGSKNFAEAARWFEKRIAANANDTAVAGTWQSLGLSQFYSAKTRQDTLKALSSIRNAIHLKPYSQYYWLIFAQIAEYADSVESAKMAYEQVVDIDSNNAQAYFGLASISYRSKDNDKAITYFKQVIRLDDKHKYAPYYLAQCYLRQKNNLAAIPYLRRYVELDPNGQFAVNSKRILKQLGAN
ncbi:tetratricopeptide repeat protein [bacterium]|nr:tetratricopeptide repeat protein [bacterium]